MLCRRVNFIITVHHNCPTSARLVFVYPRNLTQEDIAGVAKKQSRIAEPLPISPAKKQSRIAQPLLERKRSRITDFRPRKMQSKIGEVQPGGEDYDGDENFPSNRLIFNLPVRDFLTNFKNDSSKIYKTNVYNLIAKKLRIRATKIFNNCSFVIQIGQLSPSIGPRVRSAHQWQYLQRQSQSVENQIYTPSFTGEGRANLFIIYFILRPSFWFQWNMIITNGWW